MLRLSESEESVAPRRESTQARGSTLTLKPNEGFSRMSKQGYQLPHKKTDIFKKL